MHFSYLWCHSQYFSQGGEQLAKGYCYSGAEWSSNSGTTTGQGTRSNNCLGDAAGAGDELGWRDTQNPSVAGAIIWVKVVMRQA